MVLLDDLEKASKVDKIEWHCVRGSSGFAYFRARGCPGYVFSFRSNPPDSQTCQLCLSIPQISRFRKRLRRHAEAVSKGLPTRGSRPHGLTGGYPNQTEVFQILSNATEKLAANRQQIWKLKARLSKCQDNLVQLKFASPQVNGVLVIVKLHRLLL